MMGAVFRPALDIACKAAAVLLWFEMSQGEMAGLR
jgi:hypothetical protein